MNGIGGAVHVKHDLAIEQYSQALAIQRAALGKGHPDTTTARTINGIGAAYFDQGRHSLAIEQYNQALAIQRAALGESHPDTTTTARTKSYLEICQRYMLLLEEAH